MKAGCQLWQRISDMEWKKNQKKKKGISQFNLFFEILNCRKVRILNCEMLTQNYYCFMTIEEVPATLYLTTLTYWNFSQFSHKSLYSNLISVNYQTLKVQNKNTQG